MRNGSHGFWLCIAAVAAVAVFAVPAASAGVHKHNGVKIASEITLGLDHPDFFENGGHGRVKAREHACEVNREVKLFLDPHRGPTQLLGTDRTNRRGKWKLTFEPMNARHRNFSATVSLREARTAGFLCRGDRARATPGLGTR
jgi:hypothetical protein